MATFVLLPGAASDPWYWHLVVPRLEAGGHDAVAVDLPLEDETAGLAEYAATAIEAAGDRDDLVVVAQSIGAFTAPLVAAARPVRALVLVAPMVPAPGETAGEWWANTGQHEAAREAALEEGRDPDAPFDEVEVFLHDVPPDVVEESARHVRGQADKPFEEPWPLPAWPGVPTRFVLCRHDRVFPARFQRRIARERLGLEPGELHELDGGHCPALSRPHELADLLLALHQEDVR